MMASNAVRTSRDPDIFVFRFVNNNTPKQTCSPRLRVLRKILIVLKNKNKNKHSTDLKGTFEMKRNVDVLRTIKIAFFRKDKCLQRICERPSDELRIVSVQSAVLWEENFLANWLGTDHPGWGLVTPLKRCFLLSKIK